MQLIQRLDSRTALFHAGTARDADGRIVTSGGRVLGLTVLDASLRAAIDRAYALMKVVQFEGMHYRRDIGRRALAREEPKLQ